MTNTTSAKKPQFELIDSKNQIIENTLLFDSYRNSANLDEQEFYQRLIRGGHVFVIIPFDDQFAVCPSKFAGYKDNSMQNYEPSSKRDGRDTNRAINKCLESPNSVNPEAERLFFSHCEEIGVEPSRGKRTYWLLSDPSDVSIFKSRRTGSDSRFADEVDSSVDYPEGATTKVTVNAFERNPKARKACIAHWGIACVVCGIDFEATYGKPGRGFIHVHHLLPMSLRKAEYQVDPINDLRPVCPNCHAVLHKVNPPYTIEQVRQYISTGNKSGPRKKTR